jgi:hypothetical protein
MGIVSEMYAAGNDGKYVSRKYRSEVFRFAEIRMCLHICSQDHTKIMRLSLASFDILYTHKDWCNSFCQEEGDIGLLGRWTPVYYVECRLLRYKSPVRTSQETHYVSAKELSRLMLCKI